MQAFWICPIFLLCFIASITMAPADTMTTVDKKLKATSSTEIDSQTVEAAAKNRTFWVVFSAICAAGAIIGTIMQYKASNKLEEANGIANSLRIAKVRSDADVQIEKVRSDAKGAIAKTDLLAANANERAQKLENANLTLRTKLTEAEGKARFAIPKVGMRWIDVRQTAVDLQEKPKGKAEILYNPEDLEAWNLAMQIYSALGLAGWDVSSVRPVSESDATPGIGSKEWPLLVRAGCFPQGTGINVFTNRTGDEFKGSAAEAVQQELMKALPLTNEDGQQYFMGGGGQNPKVFDGDIVVIVVGPKEYLPPRFPYSRGPDLSAPGLMHSTPPNPPPLGPK